MNLAAVLSAHAEEAGRRYAVLIDGWRHFYVQAVMSPDAGTPKSMTRISEAAYANARSFLDTERLVIREISEQIALQARRDALNDVSATSTHENLPERVTELLTSSLSDLENEIVMQIERDIAFLRKSARHTALEVELAAQVQGIARSVAQMRLRIYGRPELAFSIRDRAGRRWPSHNFVRTIWRQHLLDTYNETVLSTLADFGIDRAMVSAPGANHDGQLVTMLQGAELPTYREVRDAIFHPNSEAFLAHPGED